MKPFQINKKKQTLSQRYQGIGIVEEPFQTIPNYSKLGGFDMKGEKPYSDEDYKKAKEQGLNLDIWEDWKRFFKVDEYAEEEDDT